MINSNVSTANSSLANFQNGIDTIVGAINTKAGTALTKYDSPDDIANVVSSLSSGVTGFEALSIQTNRTNHWDTVIYKAQKDYKLVLGIAKCSGSSATTYNNAGGSGFTSVISTHGTNGAQNSNYHVVYYSFNVPAEKTFGLYSHQWGYIGCYGIY